MSRNRHAGFTIIELMLSMTFIAVMLVAIALCVMQLSTIYSRGETVRQLNQVMRVVAKDIESTVQATHPFDVDAATVNAGRLCTGRYSYVWNTPIAPNANRYVNASDGQIRFIRVNDAGKALCANLTSHIVRSEATELMTQGDRSLMVHTIQVHRETVIGAAGQALYTITMLVGTDNRGAIETTANGDVCKQSKADVTMDLTYCAINEFTITIRAGIR